MSGTTTIGLRDYLFTTTKKAKMNVKHVLLQSSPERMSDFVFVTRMFGERGHASWVAPCSCCIGIARSGYEFRSSGRTIGACSFQHQAQAEKIPSYTVPYGPLWSHARNEGISRASSHSSSSLQLTWIVSI